MASAAFHSKAAAMLLLIHCLLLLQWFVFSPCFVLQYLPSCQPRVTVTSCFVYKIIRDLESIDHLCIIPIRRIGLIHKLSVDSH